ncbi:hypothetical protein TARUN_1064 [Trichoderma arundinaceum]|uniref:Uncharacterized protein n=1 Tax=Trichoderma arundinaceum TaxID=490622 RepID=A0A395NYI3_TRIAR|nr:hypothetical protein TARUN_1064 [Trichoderma arundinaceum]
MDSSGSLLFINKTQASRLLSRSKAGERSAILSHVQNNRRRHEAEVSQKPKPWSKFITTLPTSDQSDIPQTGRVSLKFVELVDKRNPVESAAAKDEKTKEKKDGRLLSVASSESLSTAVKPSYNASDPFHCTIAHLDAGTHSTLHITFSHASRANFLAESFAPSSMLLQKTPMRHDRMFRLRLRRCVEDEKLMYSTLAYGSSLLGWMMGRFDSAKQPEYFLDKALRAVRAYLSAPGYKIDDWLLLSMYALAVTEMWNGLPLMWKQSPQRHAMVSRLGSHAFAACRMHLKALLQVVNDAGGWEQFDPYVLDSVIMADKYLAVSEWKPPVIPITWDPGPLPSSIREELAITGRSILPRLGTSLLSESLSKELEGVLQDLVAYCRIASEAWSCSSIEPEAECWLFRRSQAIACRLLLHLDNDEHMNRLERCICVASLTFIFSSILARGPQVSAQHAAVRLCALLQEEPVPGEETDMPKGLRFWLLAMGSIASEASPDHEWFLQQLAEQCQGEVSQSIFEGRLESFLFLPSRQGSRLAQMIENLNSLVRKRWSFCGY